MSKSLKQTIGKLTINQLKKLSDEANKHFKEKKNEEINRVWQKLIRQETARKVAVKSQSKVKRTGVILVKRRRNNELYQTTQEHER